MGEGKKKGGGEGLGGRKELKGDKECSGNDRYIKGQSSDNKESTIMLLALLCRSCNLSIYLSM